jgi:hypothetical protein
LTASATVFKGYSCCPRRDQLRFPQIYPQRYP